jgi:hypothetical protein
MNKALISPILLALLSTQTFAADAPAQPDAATETKSIMTTPPSEPTTPAPSTDAAAAAPTTPAIDCNYHIPANQTTIDTALITSWATKATLQSFSFAPATIQNQLDALKLCFTDQGWKGFNDALQKSGNIESIKTQQLNVSSQLDGTANIAGEKKNQWKVTLPIQVVYQNDKEKVTQRLVVGVLVGRKANGDLGIMQLVATARTPENGTEGGNTQPDQGGDTQSNDQNSQPATDTPATTDSAPAAQ